MCLLLYFRFEIGKFAYREPTRYTGVPLEDRTGVTSFKAADGRIESSP